MKTERPSRNCWPTPEQRLLLRAALWSGSEALEAWAHWKTSVDVERIDEGSKRLLPLLAVNLHRLGVQDPLVPKLTMMRRLAWVQNTARLTEAAGVLRALHQASVETLVLKGVALACLYYADRGLRPMADVDVLVPTSQQRAAMVVLHEVGWEPQWSVPEDTLAVMHALAFRNAAGREFDLHWHVLMECCDPDADDDFWADAISLTVGDVPTRALSPTDLLLHVCVHGTRWDTVPPLRWIADAATLVQSARTVIDWDRLIVQARKRDLVLPVADALAVLVDVARVPIPAGVVRTLRGMPTSRFHRIEHAVRLRAPGLGGTLPRHLCQHWRRSRQAGALRAVLGLPRYLQHAYGLGDLRQLPATLLGKLTRQLRRSVGR